MKPALLSLLAALAGSSAGHAASDDPDAIYVNGKIVTVDAAFSVQQAFSLKGDRFGVVGTNEKVRAVAGKGTRVVDLRGAAVIPGLSDSHDHLWNAAKYLYRGVDMIGVTSLSEMQHRLRAAVAKAKPGEVVFSTTGWSIQPAPTRQDLDRISADVPIVVMRYRRGGGVFNSAALSRLGVSKANPMFMGANVPVDAQGEPVGASPGFPLSVRMVDALLPPLTTAQQDAMVKREMEQRNALGITSIRELAVWPDAVAGLQRMSREGKLTVRMALGVEFPDQAGTAEHLAALGSVKREDPWLFLDSTGEEPWTPGTTPGDEYAQLVRKFSQLGWRPAPHVSSDEARGVQADDATDLTLAAFEAVDKESPLHDKRWYVEHVPFATPQQMQRMAKLGVVVSAQAYGYRPAAKDSLPKQRMEHHVPIRGFLDHGIVVVSGSDYNGPMPLDLVPNNPMTSFYFYVTRKTHEGEIRTPTEKISREQALRIFTVNHAVATFQEKSKGQIAPGMLADFVILNQDLMTVPEEKILATRPLATFVGGRKVYSTGVQF